MPEILTETPEQELIRLQAELAKKKDEKAEAETKIGQLEGKTGDLSKTVDEIKKKSGSWEKELISIKAKRDKEAAFREDRYDTVKCHLTDEQKKAVEAIKVAEEEKIGNLKKKIEELKGQIAREQTAYASAQAKRAEKDAYYKSRVELAEFDNALLTDLAKLHTMIDAEYPKANYPRMYFLILEMDNDLTVLGENLPEPEQYKTMVNEAGTALSDAKNAETAAKDALEKSKKDLAASEKELIELENAEKRRKKLLEEIDKKMEEIDKPAAATPA